MTTSEYKMTKLTLSIVTALTVLVSSASTGLAGPHLQSVTCSQDYTVQAGDSISKIAQKYYGDVLDYPVIMNATNLAAQDDNKYISIADVNVVEPGQLLCIPSSEDAAAFRDEQPAGQVSQAKQASLSSNAPAQSSAVAPIVSSGDQSIRFSKDSLVTAQPFQLTLDNQVPGTIRYTTNGALPNANSMPYTGPLSINESTVLRAQVFDGETPAGEVHTKSYIFAYYDQTIPIISIVADWGDLNTLHDAPRERGEEWERPMNMEYFAPGGQIQFNVRAGIRIHGNFSRIFSPKKSYRLYFRKSYGGPGNLEYPLFEDSPVTKFDKLVLKALYQDSFHHRNIPEHEDRQLTAKYVGDQVTRNLHRNMGQPIAHGTWVVLYLNGEFWGLYNLTERIDLQFMRSYSDKDGDWDVITKEGGWNDQGEWFVIEEAKDGGDWGWLENQSWVGSADFTIPGNIGGLEWRVDMENVFSYTFLLAYVQDMEWPESNWYVYRRYDAGAVGSERQWRMMVWDAENAFGNGAQGKVDLNTLVRVYSPHDSITRILEKPFIANCGMKHRYVDRAREYLGVENKHGRPENEVGQLSKENVKAEIMKQVNIVRPLMPLEIDRWAPDLNVGLFDANVQKMLNFVDQREEVIVHHLDNLRYQTFTECK